MACKVMRKGNSITHIEHIYDLRTSAKGVPLPCTLQVWSCLQFVGQQWDMGKDV